MKKILFTVLIFMVSFNHSFARDGFFSRLFFPVTFGAGLPPANSYQKRMFVTSEGAEYRFTTKLPLFTRISYDNFSLNYSINPNIVTNAIKSRFDASVISLGGGLRTGTGKMRFSGLVQAGMMNYRFPDVKTIPGGYEVDYHHNNKLSFGALGSAEYYFAKDFAAILEANFTYSPYPEMLWGKSFHFTGFRIGITTVLF